MTRPHSIRLRGPWSLRVASTSSTADRETTTETSVVVQPPADWSDALGADFRGRVIYERFFNSPTGIDRNTPLALCLDLIDGDAVVTLNDETLGAVGWPDFPRRFEITGRLRRRNILQLQVELLDAAHGGIATRRPVNRQAHEGGGLVGEVRLEIG